MGSDDSVLVVVVQDTVLLKREKVPVIVQRDLAGGSF